MRIKTGILGCGMIGRSFIEQTLKHQGFEVVSICSKSQDSLNKASALIPQAKQYLNKEDFFRDAEIEAVIVCTPHNQHAQDAICALDSKKHVLIEKPIATNKVELHCLIGRSLQTPHQTVTALPHGSYNFIPIVRELINLNVIGKIVSLHSYLDVPGPPRSNWYYSKAAIGGASLDTLPYALGRLLMLLQNNVTLAMGLKNQLIYHRLCGDGGKIRPEVDDNATLLLLFPQGQQAIVRTNWNMASAEDFLVVQGRTGEIRVDAWHNIINLYAHQELNLPGMIKVKESLYKLELPTIHPEYMKLDVFYESIKNKRSNLQEVAYFMEIILSLLLRDGELPLPTPFYPNDEILNCLSFTDDYI